MLYQVCFMGGGKLPFYRKMQHLTHHNPSEPPKKGRRHYPMTSKRSGGKDRVKNKPITIEDTALLAWLLGARRWLAPLLVGLSGVIWALASPHFGLPFAWVLVFPPMLLALELNLRWGEKRAREEGLPREIPGTTARGWRFWGRVLLCTWPAGVVFAALTGGWVTNTAHVYGHLPWPVAFAANALGYGTLHGLEAFVLWGVPYALLWRRPRMALLLIPFWVTAWQLELPRFLYWTYGQMMFSLPQLVQVAHLLGSGGLNLLYVPLQLLLLGWLRHAYAPGDLPRKALVVASVCLGVAFVAVFAHGQWRMTTLPPTLVDAAAPDAGDTRRRVNVVGIQPNFTLARLASNPALSHSDRKQNIDALLADSSKALEGVRRDPGVSTVVLWPESVYPGAFNFNQPMRQKVQAWARENQVEVVLATLDATMSRPEGQPPEERPPERLLHGAAVHLNKQGTPSGLYHKIVLIPFGEKIPLSDLLPWYRDLLKAWIPQISEFSAGTEYSVFTLENGVGLAPMICFDASVEEVTRGMVANGARLGVVLSNLAWFGPTTVSRQFTWFARFRAIENGVPLVFLSQNGKSLLIDPAGRDASPPLGQFTVESLRVRVAVPGQPSWYALNGGWINAIYVLVAMVLSVFAWKPWWLRPYWLGRFLRVIRGKFPPARSK